MSFTTIPNEMILEIAKALPAQGLSVLSRTNSNLRALLNPLLLRRAQHSDLERCIIRDRPISLRAIFRAPNTQLNINDDIRVPNDVDQEIPLHYAAQYCSPELVATVLALGAIVDDPDPNFTPIHVTIVQSAVLGGNTATVTLILDAGGCINRMSALKRCSPLVLACMHRNVAVANLLIDRGARLDGGALVRAAYMDVVPVLERMLDMGLPVDSMYYSVHARQDLTALQYLCTMQPPAELRAIKILLCRGADVNRGAGGTWSPLSGCVKSDNVPCAKVLIDWGAERDGQCGRKTLVTVAMGRGNEKMVELLLHYAR